MNSVPLCLKHGSSSGARPQTHNFKLFTATALNHYHLPFLNFLGNIIAQPKAELLYEMMHNSLINY